MANLFEKPIAANPLSTFTQMPLQAIDAALQRRTNAHYAAKAELEAQEDSLLNLKYLSGDAERHHQLQGQFQEELDSIVDNADGDYGGVQYALDRFTRKLKQELNYGELGAQQGAYLSAMKMKEAEDKKLSDGKSSEEGYNRFLGSIQSHKTTPLEDGTFSGFKGYSSSTIADPLRQIQNGVDEVVKNWDEEGMETRTPERVINNVMNQISSNTNLLKALEERIYGKTDAAGNPIQLQNYISNLIKGVVSDKAYQERATVKDQYGNDFTKMPGAVLKNVGMPKSIKGDLEYSGGSSPLLKEFTSILGADSWGEHKASVETPVMQRRIKYMESKPGVPPFPKSAPEQRAWIEEQVGKDMTSEVTTRGANAIEAKSITKGQLSNPDAAVYDLSGRQLDADEISNIQGTSKAENGTTKTSFIDRVVTTGGLYPPGTLVMTSHDGNQYFIEPSDPEIINSPDYSSKLIDMASQTNTGARTVSIRNNIGKIPVGTYQIEHVPTKENYHNYNVYKNGKLAYRKYNDKMGNVYGVPVNQEED